MNKPLSKKLQFYIYKMAFSSLPFGGSVWNSSAKNLSDALQERGIKTKQKLFWQYKLPDNMKSQQFMNKIAITHFYEKFFTNFSADVFHDKNLTLLEKMQIMRYVWQMRRENKKNIMSSWADEIKRNNPVLANINPKSVSGFVYGALFGFAPDEIKYFCDVHSTRDLDAENKVIDKLDKLGIKTTYVLAPGTAKEIITALNQEKR